MPIDELPIPPSTLRPTTFAPEMDAFLGAWPTLRTQANTLLADAQTAAGTSTTNAGNAAISAAAAAASAITAGAVLWVSGTSYALGASVISPIDVMAYRRKIAGAGTTDPSADATNWACLGNVTLTGAQTLTNKTMTAPVLTNPTVTNYVESVYAPAAGAAFTVDLANGTVQKFTTNANTTITLPASVVGKSYLVMVAYGGVHTVTWAGGTAIKWSGGSAPTSTSVNGKYDIFAFTCDGTNTYGRTGGSNF